MLKNLWQKMKQNHLLMMVLCCLMPIVLIIGYSSLFKNSSNYSWLIILLCPLMHIFMMRGHGQNNSCDHKTSKKNELFKCPECGLKYKEKEWVEKCEAWCKEHHSCSLEITKHAIKTYE